MKTNAFTRKLLSTMLTFCMIFSIFASSPSFVYATEAAPDEEIADTLGASEGEDDEEIRNVPGTVPGAEDEEIKDVPGTAPEGEDDEEPEETPDEEIKETPDGEPEDIPDEEPEDIPDEEIEETPDEEEPSDEVPPSGQDSRKSDDGQEKPVAPQENANAVPAAPQENLEEKPVAPQENTNVKPADQAVPAAPKENVEEKPAGNTAENTTEKEQPEIENTKEKEPVYKEGKLVAKGSDFEITLSYGADAKIPEDAVLSAVEILEEHDVYETLVDKAAEKVYEEDDAVEEKPASLPYARFFDITILSVDGQVIEPAAEVTVKIDLKDDALQTEDVNFSAVHFVEEEARPDEETQTAEDTGPVVTAETVENATAELIAIEPENLGTSDADSVVEIAAETFSIYGVMYYYTVDFYYTPDGSEKAVEYHMNGGTEMMLSELFDKLGIDRDAADVTDADFTDESLVTFTREGGDWRIRSLKPFQTSEVLTLTFEDGTVLTIGVEDRVYTRTKFNNVYWEFNTETGELVIRIKNGLEGDYGINGQFKNLVTDDGKWDANGWGGENGFGFIPPGFKDNCINSPSDVKKIVFTLNNEKAKVKFINGVKSMQNFFAGLPNLEEVDLTGLDTTGITIMSGLFMNCPNLKTIKGVDSLDTSKATKMDAMFQGDKSLTNESFQVLTTTGTGEQQQQEMTAMTTKIAEIVHADMSFIDVSSAVTVKDMFNGCSGIKGLDLSAWKTDSTRSLYEMQRLVKDCTALESFVLNNAGFQTRAEGYDVTTGLPTPGGSQLFDMFEGCSSLKRVDMSNITLTGRDHEHYRFMPGPFTNNTSLETVIMKNMKTTGFMDVRSMFEGCTALKKVDMSADTPGVMFPDAMYMTDMFSGCAALETLDVSGFGKLEKIVNMDDFVDGCTALQTLNLDNLDNSHIGPTNVEHSISEGDTVTQKTGAIEYGRELDIDTCTSLQTLSAKNSKVWMCFNSKGRPGEEYYTASAESDVYYFTRNQLLFAPDALASPATDPGTDPPTDPATDPPTDPTADPSASETVTIASKRDYIDIITDRDGTEANKPTLAGPQDIADRETNINIVNGDLNTNGPGFLAPGVYTLTENSWEEYSIDLPDTYYRISYLEERPYKVEGFNDKLVIVQRDGGKSTWINTKNISWPDTGSVTIDNVGIKLTYENAAIDVNGKMHDVAITINKITFKDLDKVPTPTDPGRDHDSNAYVPNSRVYYRTVLQATQGDGLHLRNYVYTGNPSNPDDYVKCLSGGSGTDIDFTVEVVGANNDTKFVFYVDDLDVPAKQEWNRPEANEACFDNLPIIGETYGQGGESFELVNGEKAIFANKTGLVQVGKEVLSTGSDPSTVWSDFAAVADAKGARFIWKSGVACDTYALRDTPEISVGELKIRLQATKQLTGRTLQANDFTFRLEKVSADPAGAPEPTGVTFPVNASNAEDGLVDFGTFTFRNVNTSGSTNPLIGVSQNGTNDYYPGTNPTGNKQGKGKHNKFTYTYKLSELVPSAADPVVVYDNTVRNVKIEITTPENDEEMAKGIHGVIYVNDVKVGDVWSGKRKESQVNTVKLDTFKNSIKTADITIKKETVDNKTGTFDFVISFDQDKTVYDPTVQGVQGLTEEAVPSGSSWKFSLENGKDIVFKNVPFGTAYAVQEVPSANGFMLLDVDGDSRRKEAAGTISEEKDYKHVFTNRRTELVINKKVTKGSKSQSFTFEASAEISGYPANTEFSYGVIGADGEAQYKTAVTGADGSASITFHPFQLSDSKSARLVLPLGASVTVKEADPGDYDVYVAAGTDPMTEGDTITVKADPDGREVTFTNVGPLDYTEITVEKKVERGRKDQPFEFSATAEVSGLMPGKKFFYGWANDGGDERFDEAEADADGKATLTFEGFELADGESVRLSLPQGAKVTITEAQAQDYVVSVALDGGKAEEKDSITVDTKGKETVTVTFTNRSVKEVEPPIGEPDTSEDYKGIPQKGAPSFKVTTPDTPDGEPNEIVKIVLLTPWGEEAPGNVVVVAGEGRYELDPKTGVITFTPEPEFVGKTKGIGVRGYDRNYEYGQTLDPKVNCYADTTYTPVVKVKVSYVDSLTGKTVQGPTDSYVKGGKDITTDYETEDESKYGGESRQHPEYYFDGWEETIDPKDPSHYIRTAKYTPEPEREGEEEEEPAKPAPPPSVHYTVHIAGTKTWNDAGYKSGARPQAVMLHLYADGKEVAQRAVSFATGGTENPDIWTFDFGEYDMYSAGEMIKYTLTEDTPDGYAVQIASNYNKTEEPKGSRLTFSVVNTAADRRNAARTTGDDRITLLWGILALAAAAGFGGWLVFIRKKHRRS